MTRLLVFCAALALAAGCKKSDTENPDPGAGETTAGQSGESGGGDAAEPEVPQEPDPPEIAEARKKVLVADFEAAAATLGPLVDDLKARSQYRASGLAAAWHALAIVNPIAENAKPYVDHAMAMADKTQDPEVIVAANIAGGAYDIGVENFESAVEKLEKAFNTDRQGENAALAMIFFAEAKISMAFGGEDQITKPAELDSARTALEKARDAAAAQMILVGRATIDLAAVARYKNDNAKACALVAEGIKTYEEAGAADFLKEGALALKDAASCK
ncbi:MAG: hypothetical protein H6710_06725 [Myxococcales bacterium]|nr:hypothetical protein [Myxococcales bacterium]